MLEKLKHANRKVMIILVALLLAGAVYVNYRLNSKVDNANSAAGDPGVTNAGESGTTGGTGDYFETFRQEREDVRALEIEYLNEIIAAEASDDETIADAMAQKLTIVDNMEKEFTIEKLIMAKGFSDVAVTFKSGSVNVIVECDSLSSEQVAQILDIVQRETSESATNIKVSVGG